VVGDARGTMRLFAAWAPRIRSLGLPVGLVAQDGMHEIDIPWPEIDAIFIGGTDAFKLGHHAGGLVREAADRGKWAHMGRVNGVGRLKYAMSLGADSVDGSGLARFSREKMPRLAGRVIKVEDILAAAAAFAGRAIFQEDLTRELHRTLAADVETIGWHSGVRTRVRIGGEG
jgi:hypothetical protein